ncbi:DUF4239 domain-containing protein [Amycolatopsis nigrescens]|uniref:bestrophin-like domain n=1 Tax=Amycolatopsis nigrescens TaxID=381445 RepID=UPI0003797145|nr:DUF4239 domain-containing protein [Amycolatopsis nigrescens]
MFSWIYDLPNWAMFVLFVTVALAVCWGAVFLLRPVMDRLFGDDDHEQRNSLLELVLTGTGLFYGLLLGLIAAATYTTYSEASASVANEATTIAALYRDVSGYSEPLRSQLRGDLEGYVDYVIDVYWPMQQRGETSPEGVYRVDEIQRNLMKYEPATPGQEAVHGEAFSQLNSFTQARREMLNSVSGSLPSALWWVLVLGALINLILMSMLAVQRIAAHLLISGLFAVFVAMMIFLIAAMDNPFLGEFSVAPEPFELLRRDLFNRA